MFARVEIGVVGVLVELGGPRRAVSVRYWGTQHAAEVCASDIQRNVIVGFESR